MAEFKKWIEANWDYQNTDSYKQFNQEDRELNSRAQLQNQKFLDRRNFIAYHRTPLARTADAIMRNGFTLTPSGERVYGDGVYFSMGLKDWRKPLAATAYGGWIIAASIPGNRMINGQTASWQQQAKELGIDLQDIGAEPGFYGIGQQHTNVINAIAKTGKADGIVFSGKSYGTGWLVLFNPQKAKPLKVALHKDDGPIQWLRQVPPQMIEPEQPKQKFVDPNYTEMVCPHCNKNLAIPKKFIGEKIKCPLCKNDIIVHGKNQTMPKF